MRLKFLHQTGRPFPKGFTMMEILVAVLVFSVGLLGLATLQILGYRLTSDSMHRTVATILANDMIDRMRANVSATALGQASPYNNPNGTVIPNPGCLGMNPSGGFADTQCTAAQMAGNDFYEWNGHITGLAASAWHPQVTAMLPQGAGIVCIDSTPNDGTPGAPACDNVVVDPNTPLFAIKIWWVERKDTNNPGTFHRYVATFSL